MGGNISKLTLTVGRPDLWDGGLLFAFASRKHFLVRERYGRRPNPSPNPGPHPNPDPKRARNGRETRLRRFWNLILLKYF